MKLGQQDARDLRQGRGAGSTGWGRAAAMAAALASQAESPVWAGERVREAREEPFQRGAQGRARSCNVGGQLSAMERRLIPLARWPQEDSISSAPVKCMRWCNLYSRRGQSSQPAM